MEKQLATPNGDDEKLLQERRPRATKATERGKELTHIPTLHDLRIQRHSKMTKVGTEAQKLAVKRRQPEIPGGERDPSSHPTSEERQAKA
jgi:hypothetical protein